MKIGVAIPCYIGHVEPLFQLLDSIQNQSLLPDKVVVSCSSTKVSEFDIYYEKMKTYSFSLQIITNEEKKNAAQNRNIAAFNLSDVNFISFIDADDIMHPQRIEIILKAFEEHGSDIILHNYYIDISFEKELFKKIEDNDICVRTNSLRQHCSGCIEHIDFFKYINENIHHSQVSVKKSIFDIIQFPEEVEFNRKEDCIFCNRVFNLQDIKHCYIANKLSYYAPSNTIF
jgi:cellulose synthase/poly-beta-1,6-N-acetylglucosamine synthase-like glycosyltransferase